MYYPPELLIQIANNIDDYDTLNNFLLAFPEVKDQVDMRDIGIFTISEGINIYETTSTRDNKRKTSPFLFDQWLQYNFRGIASKNFYKFKLGGLNMGNLLYWKHSYTNYKTNYIKTETQKGIMESCSYEARNGAGDFRINRSWGYLFRSKNSIYYYLTGLHFFEPQVTQKYSKKKFNEKVKQALFQPGPMTFLPSKCSSLKEFTNNLELFSFNYSGDILLEALHSVFQTVKKRKLKFFVLVLNFPGVSIEFDLMLVLNYFRFLKNDTPFSIISLKSSEHRIPFYFLDSGDLITDQKVSLLDSISNVKLTRSARNEIMCDLLNSNNLPFEWKPTGISMNHLKTRLNHLNDGFDSMKSRLETEFPHWLSKPLDYSCLNDKIPENISLSDVTELTSYQVIMTRDIRSLYLKKFAGKYRKTNKGNTKDDILCFQPKKSIYKSLDKFNKKFDLDKLQQIYDDLFNTKHQEIEALTNQLKNYNLGANLLPGSYKENSYFPYWVFSRSRAISNIDNDNYENTVGCTLLKLIWKRTELLQEFLYHLPWIRSQEGEVPLQVKFNMYSRRVG